jgi:hypothetical protein
MQQQIVSQDSSGKIIKITEKAICTELELYKLILEELKAINYTKIYMGLRTQLFKEKKALVKLQQEKTALSKTKNNFSALEKAQEVLSALKTKANKNATGNLHAKIENSIKTSNELKAAQEKVDSLSRLVENQAQLKVQQDLNVLDKSINEQIKKVEQAKENCATYKKKYYQEAREQLKKKEEKLKNGQNIYSKRDAIYKKITEEAERRKETREAILKQQRKIKAKKHSADKQETTQEKEAGKNIQKAVKEKERLEEKIQDFLANLPEVLNAVLETAIDAQKKGAFIGVLANLGGVLSGANVGLDFKNILEAELHVESIGALATTDPNLIVQSSAVRELLSSERTWDAILLVLPKLLDVIKRYQTEIDDGVWSAINEPIVDEPSKAKAKAKVNDKSIMLLANLILGNKKALGAIVEIISGAGTDVILDFLHNSATLAPYIESAGVGNGNIDALVRGLISVLPYLLNSNQELLTLINTEKDLEDKIKNGLLIAKNVELISGLSQLASTCVKPVIAEALAKYNEKLQPFGLNSNAVQPLVQEILKFVSGSIKNLPQIASLLEKHTQLLSSIVQLGNLDELKKLTADKQAELIGDVFSIIKVIDPAALLQNKTVLQTVANHLIPSPFFKANVLDKIPAALVKEQSLITNLITDTLPVVLDAASFLLKKEMLEKTQEIVIQALPPLSTGAISSIMSSTFGLLAEKDGIVKIAGQILPIVSKHAEAIVAAAFKENEEQFKKFGLTISDMQLLVQGVLTFASGFIDKLPQIALLFKEHTKLLGSIVQSGNLDEFKNLTSDKQAELIGDVFSIIKVIDPAALLTLLQDKQALKKVADSFIQSPFFQITLADSITKILGVPKGEAQIKVQKLLINLITSAVPIALNVAGFLLEETTVEKIQNIAKKVPQLLSKETSDENKEKLIFEIMSSALGLLTDERMMNVITEQLPKIIADNAEPIIAEALEKNPEMLARFGQGKDKRAINLLVKNGVKFISEALKKTQKVVEVLQKNGAVYSALMNSAVLSGMHGFSVAGLLGTLENEHLAVIADDFLSIIREIDPTTILQEENKEAIKTVASGFIQSPFFQEKVLRAIPKELAVSDDAVKNLATDAVSVVLNAADFLLKGKTLEKVQAIIKKVPGLLSKDEGKEADQKKADTMFEVIDSAFELLADPQIEQVYTKEIINLINKNRNVLEIVIQAQIDKSPLKGKVDLTAKNVLDVISNPEALKVVKEGYDLYRSGHTWKAIYATVTGAMGNRVPGLRKIALHIVYDLLTGLVFQEKIMPNFLRRRSIGSSINGAITIVQKSKKDGIIQDLADILLKSETTSTGTVAKYAIDNKFLSGLNFEDTEFSNLKIDGFNFKGAAFGSDKSVQISFASSIITKTNFKDANFKPSSAALSFTNATIDLSSLKTLAKFFKSPRKVQVEGMQLLSPKIMPNDKEELINAGLSKTILDQIIENTRVSVLLEFAKKELGGEEGYKKLLPEQQSQVKKNIELILKTAGEDKFDQIAASDMFKSFMGQLPKGAALGSLDLNEQTISIALTKHCEILKRINQPIEGIRGPKM